jgi:hypothetical protein
MIAVTPGLQHLTPWPSDVERLEASPSARGTGAVGHHAVDVEDGEATDRARASAP